MLNLCLRSGFACLLFLLPVSLPAQAINPKLFDGLRWREIGPYRGGRTRALSGVPSQPSTFYIAQVNGGVFKTTDFGHTWNPIFDHQDSASVGSLAVAPSNPNVIYVGSGEGLQRPDLSTGDGVYKSTDAGKSWTHLGLRDGQQIPRIAVDPRDANRVFVAVLGHPYGPNKERGLYLSTDGGKNFKKALDKGENTGANDVVIDPSNPGVVYTSFWEARQGPWENAAWSGTHGGIFKSTDGGKTWKPVMNGLPSGADGFVQANLAIAPSNTSRIYASVASQGGGLGIYRSDDGGENWSKITTDPRPAARIGGGDLPVPAVDPKNPDVVYSASVVTWKSTDGGNTWTGIRGAPGGDDYQGIWINPTQPGIMLVAGDQGAIVTVNGGETWTNWYNQPTAQMYHVVADNAFPYRVCSGQQESGSACVSSRGNDGQITVRQWHPVGVEEYGYAVPDPLDPDFVYGGKVTRYDRRTGQVQNVGPKALRTAGFRTVRTAPLVFSPVDPHTLFFGANTLWKTQNGGQSWLEISPDLTRKTWSIPESVGIYRDTPTAQPSQRGVIYALAPSPLDVNCIWAGTDDGLVQVTFDGGKSWKNVTPKQLTPWEKISIVDASHFDKQTAYIAVNTFRLDDLRPHLYRTHDGGATWSEIVNGMASNAPVNVIREDPVRQGLLFAGSERAVYASIDDGGNWQSLRLNMPATSVRDLIVKDSDVVAATHGRGFWILDGIAPLRQWKPETFTAPAALIRPATAIRVRWDMNTDTPLPPDVPAGKNPPDGVPIDYYLGESAAGKIVKLEILDAGGQVVREYSSDDAIREIDPMLPIPKYWVRTPRKLSNAAGMHRFVWDLHYGPIRAQRSEYPMQAIVHNTAPASAAPWVMPGAYKVRLTAGGKSYTEPLTVKMDPRVKTSMKDLGVQFSESKKIYDDLLSSTVALEQVRALREDIEKREKQKQAPSQKLKDFSRKLLALAGETERFRGRGAAPGPDTLASVDGALNGLLKSLQEADALPTMPELNAVSDRRAALAKLMERWGNIKRVDLPNVNARLRSAALGELALLKPESIEVDPPTSADDDEQDLQ